MLPRPRSASSIDAAARAAATSPDNDLPEPTKAQKEAGNYRKGRVRLHGLEISIENPKGSTRSGVSPDGKSWSRTMGDHYGYVRGSEGADGDQVDVYIGPKPESEIVFVIDQLDQKTRGFDEHKCMLGYENRLQAARAYSQNFDRGWKVGPITAMTIDQFKAWLKNADTTKPAADTVKLGPRAAPAAAPHAVGAPVGLGKKDAREDSPAIAQMGTRMQDTVTAQTDEFADGGLVGKFANALSERIFGRPPAQQPAPAASAAPAPARPASSPAPGGAIGEVMRRREAAAGLADGGPVAPDEGQPAIVPENGVIAGPGTGTSDSIAAQMPTGSYVVPKDMTDTLVSAGEGALSPEVIAAASAAFLDVIKAALHTPAEEQEQSAAAPAEPPAFADGGLVDDKNRPNSFGDAAAARTNPAVQQIPTAAPTAPMADGSQSNPFTTSELGRNLSNTAAALPGVAGPLSAAARAIPSTARAVLSAPGPITRTASTAADQVTNAGSMLRRTLPAVGGLALGGAAAAAAGGGDAPPTAASRAQLQRTVAPITESTAGISRGFATPPGAPLVPANAESQLSSITQPPAAPPMPAEGKIVKDGNSYSGVGHIGENAPIVDVARQTLSRPPGISAQNEAAAQNLADRNARESLGRIMAEQQRNAPAAAPTTPFVGSGGSFGFRRAPDILMAEAASNARFNQARGTDPRSLANAAAERLAAQRSQASMAQTMLQERGADARARLAADANIQRSLIQERGLAARAQTQADAKAKLGAPLPAPAVKMQDGHLEAIGLANSMSKDLGAISNQLETGALKLGPGANLASRARNAIGFSDQNSRNYQSFSSTLEKLRNDSLRLNSGVQTEGDAQRAWGELIANVNDPAVVRQRIGEIQAINERAAGLRMRQNDAMRANYGAAPMDYSEYSTGVKPAVGAGQQQQRSVSQQGMHNGRRVVKYSDGSIEYADQ